MASLRDDTIADKLLRFVIGAFIGALSCFLFARSDPGGADQEYLQSLMIGAVACGVLSVVLGNRFIEWMFRKQRLP
jgi:hypothetical protein